MKTHRVPVRQGRLPAAHLEVRQEARARRRRHERLRTPSTSRPRSPSSAQAKTQLDVVYVSHIDDDHISGVLKLDGRPHATGASSTSRSSTRKPATSRRRNRRAARPPEVRQDLAQRLPRTARRTTRARSATCSPRPPPCCPASQRPHGQSHFEDHHELAASKKQAIELVRRIGRRPARHTGESRIRAQADAA